MMGVQEVIVGLAVLAAAIYLAWRWMPRSAAKKLGVKPAPSCGACSDCGGCPGKGAPPR